MPTRRLKRRRNKAITRPGIDIITPVRTGTPHRRMPRAATTGDITNRRD
ncbi:MAG TPA: hypothetical protein V6C72_19815 [Chroococcales cyanobacterium]